MEEVEAKAHLIVVAEKEAFKVRAMAMAAEEEEEESPPPPAPAPAPAPAPLGDDPLTASAPLAIARFFFLPPRCAPLCPFCLVHTPCFMQRLPLPSPAV